MKTRLARLRRIGGWTVLAGMAGVVAYLVLLKPLDAGWHRVSRGAVVVEALGTGSVESRRSIEVGFEVTGRVRRIDVDQGDSVTEGQLLSILDDDTFRADVSLAEQEVSLARSTLRRLEADIERAEAVLSGAEEALERTRPLVEKGVASEEALDVVEERHRVAAAELARALAAELEGQEAIVAATLKLERAKTALDRTVVRSPFDGVVSSRVREVGDIAVPGASVLELAATDTVWASVWVDEIYLDQLATGLPARITLRSNPERSLRGTVVRIGREVDRETRELLVDVAFHEVPENLVFGQRVDLWIELARRDEVDRVPGRLVIQQGEAEGVFVAEGSRARSGRLRIGARGREYVEVIEGLEPGDVVLEPFGPGKERLKEGDRVRLRTKAIQEGAR